VVPAARAIGLQIQVLNASTSREIDAAFASIVRERPDALFVGVDPFLISRRAQLVNLMSRHAVPATFPSREFTEIGGLMSYGANIPDAYHQVGVYAARILKGAKPGRAVRETLAAIPRRDFSAYRMQIDHSLIEGWWWRHAAAALENFYFDLLMGQRPKLVLKAPPHHGKSRLVTDFVSWVAGKQPDWSTIYASYSDELGTTANLRLQRTMEGRAFRTVFPATWLAARAANAVEGQRNIRLNKTV
jgi:hypothetical protein